jgi:hypothetical protein
LVDEASRLARELGAGHVELRHRESKSLELPLRSDKVSMLLALPVAEDSLWRGFSSKLRAQIRRPQKEGAVCVSGGAELLNDFYAVFAHNMRDLGTPVFRTNFRCSHEGQAGCRGLYAWSPGYS